MCFQSVHYCFSKSISLVAEVYPEYILSRFKIKFYRKYIRGILLKINKNNYEKKLRSTFLQSFLAYLPSNSLFYFNSIFFLSFCNFYFVIIQSRIYCLSFGSLYFLSYTFWVFIWRLKHHKYTFIKNTKYKFDSITFWLTTNTSVFNVTFVLVLIVLSFAFWAIFIINIYHQLRWYDLDCSSAYPHPSPGEGWGFASKNLAPTPTS